MRRGTVRRWLRDTITLSVVTGVDAYGQPSTSSSSVPGRVMRNHRRSRDTTGEEFTSLTQVLLLDTVSVGDSLTIDGVERSVRAVKASAGVRGGVTLYEALL